MKEKDLRQRHRSVVKDSMAATETDNVICKRCGFVASRRDALLQHLRRKNTCLPKVATISVEHILKEMSLRNNKSRNIETNTYDCCHCGKKYKSCAGKCYHEKRCSKNEALFQNTRSETALQFKHLQDQILELHNIITTASGNDVVPSTTTNNITNNTQNITQINIVDFGQENLSSLTHEFLKDCLLRCQPTETLPDDNENGMTKLWKKINSIPENRNVRVRNISHGFYGKTREQPMGS